MAEDGGLAAERERVYRLLSPRVVTAFNVPTAVSEDDGDELHITKDAWTSLLHELPFPCIRVAYPPIEHMRMPNWPPGVIATCYVDMVIDSSSDEAVDGYLIESYSIRYRAVYRGPDGSILPTESFANTTDDYHRAPLRQLSHLLALLRNSRSRYIEKPMSRQVKRAQGIRVPDYHEYIIIDRRDVKEGDNAKRWSDIARRHAYLHAVRAHLRRLECGRLVQVRAHTRGKGTLFQVKDYKVMAGIA